MTESEPRQDPRLPEDARLTSLERRLKRAQADEAQRSGGRHAVADHMKSPGYRVLSVLIGYPLAYFLAYVVLATAWNWWRFRQRLQREEQP